MMIKNATVIAAALFVTAHAASEATLSSGGAKRTPMHKILADIADLRISLPKGIPKDLPNRLPRRKALFVLQTYPTKSARMQHGMDVHAKETAKMMRDLLTKDLGFKDDEITIFDDKTEPITSDTLHDKLVDFLRDTIPGDVVVLYFCGHAGRFKYEGPIDPKETYVLTKKKHVVTGGQLAAQTPIPKSDEDPKGGVFIESLATSDKGYYRLEEAVMHASEGVKIIGVFDCCYGQKFFGNKYTLDLDTGKWNGSKHRKPNDKKLVIGISASRAGQKSAGMRFVRGIEKTAKKLSPDDKALDYFRSAHAAAEKDFFGGSRQNLTVTCSTDQLNLDSDLTLYDLFSMENAMPALS